jgi:DUF4097 and DUF4098 domain-containing protein YvlB
MKLPALLLTAVFSLVLTARASVKETFRQTYPLALDGTISLENVNGEVEITAWDKAEVSLVADKVAQDDDELKRLEILVEAKPDRLMVKTHYVKKAIWSFFGNWGNASVHYKLLVPATVRLDKIDGVNSVITVTGVKGTVNLDAVNGAIKATGLAADARLNSVNGGVAAEFSSLEKVTEVKLASVNGAVELTLPKGANASLKTSSVNGKSSIEQPIKLSRSGWNGVTGEIGAGGPRVSIETVNGGITVREARQ